MGGITLSVTYTWWLLWQPIEIAWLVLGRPICPLVAQMSLETLLSACKGIIFDNESGLGSKRILAG